MESLKILVLCVASAVLYGVAHDTITARVCVEYFTIGHPDLFGTDSPTLLALGWGVAATWWVGVGLGLPLAIIARAGRRPKLSARELVRPLAMLMAATAVVALGAGVAGYAVGQTVGTGLIAQLQPDVPETARARFLADACAHQAAYASGFVGGLALWAWAWGVRSRRGRAATTGMTGLGA